MSGQGFDMRDKNVVVTGASSGIGRATARIIGELGGRVMLVARDQAALERVAGEIREGGGVAEVFAADMSDREQTLAAIDAAETRLGPLDGFFANAGAGGAKAALVDYSDEDFDRILNINLKSAFWAMKRVLPGMAERRRGSFLVTGSIASEKGLAGTVGYNVSKHGVQGLVRTAAAEMAKHNVRVNMVIPGLIETRMLNELADEMTGGDVGAAMNILGGLAPMGRVGGADELGRVAAFLLSDAASYVTGQSWSVDGGILHTLWTQG